MARPAGLTVAAPAGTARRQSASVPGTRNLALAISSHFVAFSPLMTAAPPPRSHTIRRAGARAEATQVLSNALMGALESSPLKPAAGLVHATDGEPGITRIRRGRSFCYRDPAGRIVRDRATLDRIRKLAVPPAYRDVWICIRADGHLQATGRDARGRKQYRYHADFRALRDSEKFNRMLAFGRALPALRARVRRDLARPELDKNKVVALVVRLLETTLVRVGNEEYVAANGSYGLTTLRKRHLRIAGAAIELEFKAKSGKLQQVGIWEPPLTRAIRALRDLPGQHLFQYIDAAGVRHPVGSTDVNAYLQAAMGRDFTAKDFRTWMASLLAAVWLSRQAPPANPRAAGRLVRHCLTEVSAALGNTVAVCRKSYVHPELIRAFAAGTLARDLGSAAPLHVARWRVNEAAMLRFCRQLSRTRLRTGPAAACLVRTKLKSIR